MPKSDTASMQVLSSLGVNSIPGFRHRESLSDPHVVSPVGPGLRLPRAGPFPAPAVSWASFTWCDCFSSGTEPELPGQLDVWEQGAGGGRGGGETGPRHLERTRVHLRLGVKGAWDPQRKQFPVHRPWRQPSGPPTGSGRKWDLDTFGQLLWLFHPRNLNAAFFFCAS